MSRQLNNCNISKSTMLTFHFTSLQPWWLNLLLHIQHKCWFGEEVEVETVFDKEDT